MHLKYLILFLIMFLVKPFLAGNITITLVGTDPLTINVKGNTINEQAGSISIYLYYRDDATTDLAIGNVDASQIETVFGWGTSFATKSIETGSWIKGGHTFTRRLFYDNADISTQDDFWSTTGVNAIIVDFTTVGSGHAFIEVNGTDGMADYSGTGHNVSYVNQDVPLPVELSSFLASVNQNSVNLNWQTKTEVDNYGFEIERAIDPKFRENRKFEKIGFVPGSGNSNSQKDYSFADNNPSGGSKFVYRLKQVDTDGKFQYSNEIAVDFVPDKFQLFQNYPNPFNPKTQIKFSVKHGEMISVKVYDNLGNEIKVLMNEYKTPGFYTLEFNGSGLSSGIYFLKFQEGNSFQVKKLVLMK